MTGLTIDWIDESPERIAARLALAGVEVDADGVVLLGDARLRLLAGPRGVGRLETVEPSSLLTAGPAEPAISAQSVDLIGVGWATVDSDRFVAGIASDRFGPAGDDVHLGASAQIGRGRGPTLVVLEPSTEGRLAAGLVRNGEGPAVLYLSIPPGVRAGAAVGPIPGLSQVRDGPLGPSRLLVGGPASGPHVIFLEPAGGSS